MNTKILAGIAIFAVLGIGFLTLKPQQSSQAPGENENTLNQDSAPVTNDSTQDNRYIEYSKPAFDTAQDKKRVYFFHASWCPTCKTANAELTANNDKIPSDVIVFKTDYDTQADLKKRYSITYQHTFVLVDGSGNEISKWNGGALDEIVSRTQ